MTDNIPALDALKLARKERDTLVPILGAGTSVSLGLPTWPELVNQLHLSATQRPSGEGAVLSLGDVRNRLGAAHFTAKVQDLLRLSGSVTSSALQAIATAPIRRIITTNLDFGIEAAFSQAGVPLGPHQVGRGCAPDELALFDSPDRVLLKVHGSLERPGTWVLTQEQYDAAYVSPGPLKEFLGVRIQTPLFIGFSFSDGDVNEALRLAHIRWQNHAYAVVPAVLATARRAEFASRGIIPIPFWSFDQIPEIIDEIFECAPLRVRWSHSLDTSEVIVRVGAASVAVNGEIPFDQNDAVPGHPALKAIANALELQPARSKVTGAQRRRHGIKGSYRADAFHFIKARDATSLVLFLRAVATYRDIFIEGVLPSLLRRSDLDEDDYFWLVQHTHEALDGNPALADIDQFLLQALHAEEHDFRIRRVIAKALARRGLHPGLLIPPSTVRVGGLDVSVYPLTQSQVALLRGNSSPGPSVRPYILESLHEVEEIIERLRVATGRPWRIPTAAEWLGFAGLEDGRAWPWGSEAPAYRQHAHLNISGNGGAAPKSEVEVGLYPRGRSPAGLYDLIGNVHEIVLTGDPDAPYRLAGGAWTSKFNAGWKFRAVTGLHYPKRNAGIRPVVDAQD